MSYITKSKWKGRRNQRRSLWRWETDMFDNLSN